jgi:acetamidase/formamidase
MKGEAMSNFSARLIFSLLLFAPVPSDLSAAEYALMPSPQTVHIGHFSAALKPVLTIDSGDIVTIETVGGPDPIDVDASGVVPPSAVPEYARIIRREVTDRGPGPHILTGPVFINGAMLGDVLEVRILEIDLAVPYGFNTQRPYTGALPEEFPGFFQRIIPIDRDAKTAAVAPGVVVPVTRPFFGVMGVAPLPVMGRISSGPPGVHTGNIDNKDVGAGSTLYLPVYAPGALFSVGDAHAAQGQGEVDLTAIETGLRGKFQFIVRKDMKITWPRAETPTHWIVMGLSPNLEEAMKMAVRETINFITQRFPKLSREEAYMIASIAVDYHVTQVVEMAHLYDSRRRRTRQRDLERRQRALAPRRRLDLGDRDLRSGHRPFYQGIGNAGPDFDPEYRPGDNKWAASVLAISPSGGKIKWGYQYTPNDPYDYDEISEHPIIDAKINGEDRKLVVHAARNGFFYALDRTNGSFVAGKQYVDQLNWTPGLDSKTGKPLNYDPNADVQIYAPGSHGTRMRPLSEKLCPSVSGGKNWQPGAYNPQLGLIYIPSIEGCSSIQTTEQKDRDDQGGTVKPPIDSSAEPSCPPPPGFTARSTAGNLVFLGHIDGTFSAYDAKTLKELWSFNVGTGINAPAITYAVNGKQYVAVLGVRDSRTTSSRRRPSSRTRRRRRCCSSSACNPPPFSLVTGALSTRR